MRTTDPESSQRGPGHWATDQPPPPLVPTPSPFISRHHGDDWRPTLIGTEPDPRNTCRTWKEGRSWENEHASIGDSHMWRSIRNRNLGMMNVFNDVMVRHQWSDPDAMPNLRESDTVLVASDYSGHHAACHFESYGYLYITHDSWPTWERCRLRLRERFGLRRRTFAYKKLGDKKKRLALDWFLAAADQLHGACITVLIDRKLKSLFPNEEGGDREEARKLWPNVEFTRATFERLMRVVHLNSFFLAGLVGHGQNILWFTDQDDIAANPARVTVLTRIWSIVLSNYLREPDDQLPITLGHLRCGTTASDSGTLQIEDLAAIPDLVAGALAEAYTCFDKEARQPTCAIAVPPPSSLTDKAKRIVGWLTAETALLKRHVFSIEATDSPTQLKIKRLKFHGA